ncbi:MAG TPA: hypothetical protein PKE04_18355, partial [Clostridia bacterium]|nr:hypothetical protein [Clostridia bacterium]
MQHDSGRGGRRKRSVLKHYFATYSLAVVCVCLLVYGVSVVLFTRQYRINTLENHLQRCQRLQNDMNAEMMRLQEIATHIGSNLLLTATQLNNSYDYYLAVQELKKYQIASRYVDEILLIYPEDTLAYAITSIATYRSDTLDAYFGISAAQLAQWGERMKPMMIWTRADANRISREKLYYLVSLYRPVNRGKGIVLYSLDVEGIRRTMLSSLDVSEGAVFLLSEEGRPILSAHTTRSQVREEDIEQYLTHFVNGQSVYQDRSVTCVYRASGLYGGFLTIIQQGGAEAAFQRTQALLAGLLLGLLMLGQAIAWALARHAYRPIRTLTETVHRTQEAGSGVFQPDMNEFQYIARAFEVTRMEKQALISNVLSKSRTQIEDVLLSLLRGNHHVVEKNYLLETLGMTLNLPRYRLVLILLDRYREYQASVDADDCDRTKSALAELLQKHIGRRVFVYCTESTDGSRLIALCNYGDAVTDEDFAEASRRMQEEIAATLDVTVTVVLGGAYADLSQTARQRQILFDAARHRLIVGWNALIYADHIPLEPTNQSSPYSEYDLYLCYKTGECQKVAFMLAEIFDRSTRAMTAAMAIVEYHKVLGVMYKVNS